MAKYVPRRGDMAWLTLCPQAGHEQAGRRPVLVLSPQAYNRSAQLAVVCPVTNQVKDYPFEVTVPEGLAVRGAILADQARSLDWAVRDAELICTLPAETVSEVVARLAILLQFGNSG